MAESLQLKNLHLMGTGTALGRMASRLFGCARNGHEHGDHTALQNVLGISHMVLPGAALGNLVSAEHHRKKGTGTFANARRS